MRQLYMVQIDAGEWQTFLAETPQDAIVEAIKPLVRAGNDPEKAFVALTKRLHSNGLSIMAQGYSLTVNRNERKQ